MKPEDVNEELLLNVFITTCASITPFIMAMPCKLENCIDEATNMAFICFVLLLVLTFLSYRWVKKQLDWIYWIIICSNLIITYMLYNSELKYQLRGIVVFIICTISFLILFLTNALKVIKKAATLNEEIKEK